MRKQILLELLVVVAILGNFLLPSLYTNQDKECLYTNEESNLSMKTSFDYVQLYLAEK